MSGSSTNPFSSGFFEARLAAAEDVPAVADDDNELGACEPLDASVAIQDLSLSEIPAGAENARIVISPRGSASPLDDGGAIVPFRGPGHGELLAVLQSSKSAWFSLTLAADLQCTFYYDPASDNLVLRNSSRQPIQVGPIQDDNAKNTSLHTLEYRDVHLVSPGLWRMYSVDNAVLIDFLVLRRRYLLETQSGGTQAGSKRKDALSIEGRAKRHRTETGSSDQSIVLISKPPNVSRVVPNSLLLIDHHQNLEMETTHLELVRVGNPLVNLQPGHTVVVTTARGDSSPEDQSQKAITSHVHDVPESYSLLHMRDIASTKGFASVFSARHNVFGDTAVKVIRTKQASQYSYIPTMAQNWKHEEQILRKVKHVSDSCPGHVRILTLQSRPSSGSSGPMLASTPYTWNTCPSQTSTRGEIARMITILPAQLMMLSASFVTWSRHSITSTGKRSSTTTSSRGTFSTTVSVVLSS